MTGAHAFAAGARLRKLGKSLPPSDECPLFTGPELDVVKRAAEEMEAMRVESEAVKQAEDEAFRQALGFEVTIRLSELLRERGAPAELQEKLQELEENTLGDVYLSVMVDKSARHHSVAVGCHAGDVAAAGLLAQLGYGI